MIHMRILVFALPPFSESVFIFIFDWLEIGFLAGRDRIVIGRLLDRPGFGRAAASDL
jgi:hypothetical protein